MSRKYAVGLDYGTNSVRALVVDVKTGEDVGTSMFAYPSDEHGILLDRDPQLARQNPQDHLDGLQASIRGALEQAMEVDGFDPQNVIGIGVDTTGSTPLPVDAEGVPLAFDDRFKHDLAAYVWLWQDHTSHAEAAEITETAAELL